MNGILKKMSENLQSIIKAENDKITNLSNEKNQNT